MHYNQLCLHLLIRNSVTRLDDFNIFNYFISTKVAQNVCWLLGLFKICHFRSKTDVITYWATFENLGYILFQNLVTLHLGHRDNVAFTKAKEATMQVAFILQVLEGVRQLPEAAVRAWEGGEAKELEASQGSMLKTLFVAVTVSNIPRQVWLDWRL